jgi:UTP-glucose-1-phosphate uridylyltransferase
MKPTLLIMAAGMASRYGSLKPIDKIGPSGETIIDYSVYDAIRAGFGKVVFVIRRAIERDFQKVIIDKLKDHVYIDCVFQELTDVPQGTFISKDRVKPWGTAHAIWVANKKIENPFLVINADDFYGFRSFKKAADFLSHRKNEENTYCNIGYILKNTLSEHGYVSRGELLVNDENMMTGAFERTHIKNAEQGTYYQDENEGIIPIDEKTMVSMNMWGFTPTIFNFIEKQFNDFINENALDAKTEFVIPKVINQLIHDEKVQVKVIPSQERWFGLTYPEDRAQVKERVDQIVESGSYPESLWK